MESTQCSDFDFENCNFSNIGPKDGNSRLYKLREAHFIKNVILGLCIDLMIAALSLLPGIARLADFGSELMMAMLRPKDL